MFACVGLLIAITSVGQEDTEKSHYGEFIKRALKLRAYREMVLVDSLEWAINEAQLAKDYPELLKARIVLGSQWMRADQQEKGDSIFTIAWRECSLLKGKDKRLKAAVISEIANIQYLRGNLDSTWVLQNMVYEVDKEFNDTTGMIIALHNIANAANAMGKRNLAMENLTEAINLCRQANDTDRIASIISRIAFIYHLQKNYKMAIKNFREAEAAITKKSEDVRLMNQLGLAESLADTGNFELALEIANGVIKPNMSGRDKAIASSGLSNLHIMMGDTQKAMPHLVSNYEYGLEYGIPYFSLDAALELGIIWYGERDYEKAKIYLEKAWEILETYGMLKTKVTVAEYLAKLSVARGNSVEGLERLNTLIILKDSFAKEAEVDKLAEAQVKYETEKTERENAFLNEKNTHQAEELSLRNRQIVVVSSLSAVLLALLILIITQRQTLRRKNHQLVEQNQLIASQSEALKALDKQKNTFFANVSHELRTPLTLILGPLEKLVSGKLNLPRAASGNLNLAYQATQRLKELVEEVLDVTRLTDDKLKLNLKAENFDQFIHRVHSAFESMAELKNQKLLLNYKSSKQLMVSIDRDKVEKVISNLVSNAFKFSPENTDVIMTVSRRDEKYFVEIQDQGPGIDEGEITKVFERNYQTTNALEGGLGIGLWLSRELAHLMQGDITIKNNDGAGAIFSFSFKAEESELTTKSVDLLFEDEIELPELSLERKARVLVVEDNAEMREFVLDTLKPYFTTYEAGSGKEALNVLKTREVDLITSDVMMPGLGGFELLAEVRANSEWNHIPFVMITARSDEDSRINALKEGVDDYVIKPFLSRELVVRVHNILKNYLLRRQSEETEELKTADEQDSDILEKAINEHLTDDRLSAEMLSDLTAMSERTIYRQIKSIFGLTPAQYIKEKRLLKARKILENEHRRTVSEVAFEVGYGNAKTFSKHFLQRFGKYPSEYID